MPPKRKGGAKAKALAEAPWHRAKPKKEPPKKENKAGNKKKKKKGKNKLSVGAGPSLSAFARDLVPTMSANGKAFPTWARNYFDLSVDPTTTTVLFFTNTGTSSIFGGYATFLAAGGGGVPTNLGTWCPLTLAANDDNGGPSSARAMKCSVSITNTTKRLDQGGRVAILNTSNRIAFPTSPISMTHDQWNSVVNGLRAQAIMETPYDGADFVKPKVRHCDVVDRAKYEYFDEWIGSMDNTAGAASAGTAPNAFGNFFSVIGHWPGGPHNDRRMSTTVVIFSQVPTSNVYSVDIRGAWYTRWPTTNILSNHLVPIPHLIGNALGVAPKVDDKPGW